MRSTRAHISVASVVLGFACFAAPGPVVGASSIGLSGAISGFVTDGAGVPQMGAAVMLFNRQDRLFEKVFTDEKGLFSFTGLIPDTYSIRVTLASFVPAIKSNILVQPGIRSILNVSMATLFSSIHLMYPTEHPAFMSDDWKWALRTASSTRPVLRLLPQVAMEEPKPHKPVFSDTRGLLMFSAGDGAMISGFGSSADMGTAFALATSLFGSNQLQFAGNVGSGAQSGVPSASFRTTYNRSVGPASPEVSVTMRELFLPGRVGAAIFGAENGIPVVRSLSANFQDHTQISDALSVQYGISMDSISFMDHIGYLSPYARLTYSLGHNGDIEFDYTSGNARPDLAGDSGNSEESDNRLQRDIGALGQFPLISLRGGRAEVQRGEDFELGYSRTVGSRKYAVSIYREAITNLALNIASPDGFLPSGDVLPDFFSGTSIFDAGNFSSTGLLASITQRLGDHVSATAIYGSMGALTAAGGELVSNNPDELRSMIRSGRQNSVTTRVDATSPWTGTHIVASYQVADSRWAVPGHMYSTGSLRPEPGFNLNIRQPIPGLSCLPWRMEATADIRNLLAQGYLPISAANGSRLVLMQNPRMFRGGLSFIF
jgi:hypothetical protein